jgi:hypothetical protein
MELHASPETLYFKTKVLWKLSSSLHPTLPKVTSQGKDFSLAT